MHHIDKRQLIIFLFIQLTLVLIRFSFQNRYIFLNIVLSIYNLFIFAYIYLITEVQFFIQITQIQNEAVEHLTKQVMIYLIQKQILNFNVHPTLLIKQWKGKSQNNGKESQKQIWPFQFSITRRKNLVKYKIRQNIAWFQKNYDNYQVYQIVHMTILDTLSNVGNSIADAASGIFDYIKQPFIPRNISTQHRIVGIPQKVKAGAEVVFEIGQSCKFVLGLAILAVIAGIYAFIIYISPALGQFAFVFGLALVGIYIAFFIYSSTNCCRKPQELLRDLLIVIICVTGIISMFWVFFQVKKINTIGFDSFPTIVENQDFYQNEKPKQTKEQSTSRLEKEQLKQLLENKEIIKQLVQLEIQRRQQTKNEYKGSEQTNKDGQISSDQL